MKKGTGAFSESLQTTMLDRVYWVQYAKYLRMYQDKDPWYAAQVAALQMFLRVGLPILSILIAAWSQLDRWLPTELELSNLSPTLRLAFGCTFVAVMYGLLYRRSFRYVERRELTASFDTPGNRRLAAISLAVAVASPLIAWTVIRLTER
jgi:hypothetical protein